ncbi:MAG: C13 family peptidase [Dokdonella sp.]
MNPLARQLLDGVRAAFLFRPRSDATAATATHFIALLALYLIAATATAWFDTAAPRLLNGNGIVVILADAALTLVAAWILVRQLSRPTLLWGTAAVTLATTLAVVVLIDWPLGYFLPWLAAQSPRAAIALELLRNIWWLLILIGITRLLASHVGWRALVAAVMAFAVSGAAWWFLPGQSIFSTQIVQAAALDPDVDGNADAIEEDVVDAPSFSAEAVMFNQASLLRDALDAIKPREPGKTNLYVISFAGDGSEDVFRNEAEYVERLFSERFDNAGRVLTLINNPSTVTTHPLATLTNLRLGVQELASKMDPEQDILLVFLTSHGSEDHQLLVDLPPLPLEQIEPGDLQRALRTEPDLRWKVLIVSACYSGGFIKPLRDDGTMMITASRADRTSFGCGSNSKITWFGKAFFADGLNKTTSLREAFDLASADIRQWETDDHVEDRSEPQIASNRRIEAKLDQWLRGRKIGPAIPFDGSDKENEGAVGATAPTVSGGAKTSPTRHDE